MRKPNNRLLKVCAAVAVLLIGVACFYYYVIFLPQHQKMVTSRYVTHAELNARINSALNSFKKEYIESQKTLLEKMAEKIEKSADSWEASLRGDVVRYLESFQELLSNMQEKIKGTTQKLKEKESPPSETQPKELPQKPGAI